MTPDSEFQQDLDPAEADQPPPLPTSELLIRLVEEGNSTTMSVGELIDGLGGRAFSIILLILTLPIAVPGPPGLPTVFSIPLLIVTAQLWLGRPIPWLPGFVRRRSFARSGLLAVLLKVRPWLAHLEDFCRPRLKQLTGSAGQRWIGVFFFLCAIVLTNPIPIPFSHLPLAIALAILSLGFVERDGVVIIGAGLAALVGIAVNLSLTGSLLVLGVKLLHLA